MDAMRVVGSVEGHVPQVEKPTFERIVQDHSSFVRRTLAHLGVVARHLADVEQEVFRGVHRGLTAFDPSLAANPETAVRAWLFGICERQAASHRRAEMRRAEVLLATEDLDAAQDDRPDSEDRFEAAERKALLFQLLATLEPRRRAVIIAYELEGMEMVEVAAATGIPVNTCWNRLRLARADLRAAWTRLSAQRGNGAHGVLLPLAFLSPTFPGDAVSPMGLGEWLYHSAREWLFHDLRERVLGEAGERILGAARRWLLRGKASATIKVAAVLVPGVGLLAAAAVALTPPHAATADGLNTVAALPVSPAVAEIVPEPPARSAQPGSTEDIPGAGMPEPPASPAATGALAPTALVRRPSSPPVVARAGAAGPRPAGGGSVPVQSSGSSADVGLRAESANLDNALAAYQSGDTARAKRLLDRYDHLFPAGQMRSTSLLLRLRNLMATGCRNEARDKARAYLAAHPDSTDRALIENIVGKL